MRAELARHFDVVVVIWALALLVSWSFVTLARAPLSTAQWDTPQYGPAWVVPAGG
jgi:heme A synthase